MSILDRVDVKKTYVNCAKVLIVPRRLKQIVCQEEYIVTNEPIIFWGWLKSLSNTHIYRNLVLNNKITYKLYYSL